MLPGNISVRGKRVKTSQKKKKEAKKNPKVSANIGKKKGNQMTTSRFSPKMVHALQNHHHQKNTKANK
jgi:hypothetical protein